MKKAAQGSRYRVVEAMLLPQKGSHPDTRVADLKNPISPPYYLRAGFLWDRLRGVCPTERKTTLLATVSCARPTLFVHMWYRKFSVGQTPSLHFSPHGETKCVRGASVRGARRLTSGGVPGQYVEHGDQAQRSNGGPSTCFGRQVVRNAGWSLTWPAPSLLAQ